MAKATPVEKSEKEPAAVTKDRPEKESRPVKKEIPQAQPPRDPARESALSRAVQQIEKQFGKGSVMRLDSDHMPQIEGFPTGSLSLDIALGGVGIPKGRIIEVFGPESSGKTTLTLHAIANCQKTGGVAAFIDAEHALDPSWAKRLGVKLDELLVSQPDSGEEALSICETLARSNALDVIVIDSVAALVPKAELEGEMGMATMGMQARLMSQALRKLTAILAKAKTTCVFINQMREKVGVMFGNPETTSGGKALKFYASVRIDIRRKDTLKDAAGTAIGTFAGAAAVGGTAAGGAAGTGSAVTGNTAFAGGATAAGATEPSTTGRGSVVPPPRSIHASTATSATPRATITQTSGLDCGAASSSSITVCCCDCRLGTTPRSRSASARRKASRM